MPLQLVEPASCDARQDNQYDAALRVRGKLKGHRFEARENFYYRTARALNWKAAEKPGWACVFCGRPKRAHPKG